MEHGSAPDATQGRRVLPFVAGMPASFATAAERPWKDALLQQLAGIDPEPAATCLSLEFVVAPRLGYANGADLDNLCEPVFSMLVNRLGWFGGRRPNIAAFRARKVVGVPTGLTMTVYARDLPGAPPPGKTLLDAEARGSLPVSARDVDFATWAAGAMHATRGPGAPVGIELRFGARLNLGDIATGRVKSVIDCLYPVIGGRLGAPDDSAVFILEARRDDPRVSGSVHVRVVELTHETLLMQGRSEGAGLLGNPN